MIVMINRKLVNGKQKTVGSWRLRAQIIKINLNNHNDQINACLPQAGITILLLHSPIEQANRPIAIRCILFRMRNLDDGYAFIAVKFLEKLHDLFSLLRIEIASWFVGQK